MTRPVLNEQDSINAARQVMQSHIDALNAGDAKALTDTLHFPHYRLSGGALKTWETPESYLDDFYARAGDGWDHSAFTHVAVIDAAKDKVHLNVDVERYRKDGSVITRFRSVWIISLLDAVWAAQMRSSFAPDRAGVPVT